MHTNNLLIDQSRHWEPIETVCKGLPEFYIITSSTFIVEAIDSVDGRTFMVAAKKEEVFRIFYFIGQ